MGTGRQRFGQRWRHRQVKVSGKTGSLSQEQPTFIHYTWFVAFAPVDKPRLAVAALVGNGPLWHIKGLDLAREVMDAFFGPPSGTRPVASRPTLTGSGKSGSAPARAKTRTGKAGSPPASARSASTGAKSKAGAGKQPGSGKANAGGKTSR